MLRWGLGIFWKWACPNVAMVSQDWLEAAGPNCNSIAILIVSRNLLCTINTQKQLGDTSLSWILGTDILVSLLMCFQPTSVDAEWPCPKNPCPLGGRSTPILKTFNVKATSKITTQKRRKLSTSHFIVCTFDTGWAFHAGGNLHFLGDDFSPRIPWTPSALLKSWAATAEKTVPPWRKHLGSWVCQGGQNTEGFWMFFRFKGWFYTLEN